MGLAEIAFFICLVLFKDGRMQGGSNILFVCF